MNELLVFVAGNRRTRASAIAREIENLKFATFRIDVDAKRQRLSAELAAITA